MKVTIQRNYTEYSVGNDDATFDFDEIRTLKEKVKKARCELPVSMTYLKALVMIKNILGGKIESED